MLKMWINKSCELEIFDSSRIAFENKYKPTCVNSNRTAFASLAICLLIKY